MIIYFCRHAEKAGPGTNPQISSAGRKRAKVLAHVLSDAKLDAVYVTQFLRTQMTGEPVADAADLTPFEYNAADPGIALSDAMNNHPDGTVLIIGHSNTMDDIARKMGIDAVPELGEHEFDRLFAIHVCEGKPHLIRLRYGAPTPD